MRPWEVDTTTERERWPRATLVGGRCPGAQSLHLAHALLQAPQEGLVLEFGVGRGRTLRMLAGLLDPVLVHGFDSFLGLPEDWEDIGGTPRPDGVIPAGTFNTGGKPPEGLPANVELHVGWYDRTLEPFLADHAGPCRLVHVDCDLYSSTRTVLGALGAAGRIVPGTILAFDELWNYSAWRRHEWRAWCEAAEMFGWRWEVISYIPRGYQAAVRVLPHVAPVVRRKGRK